MQLTGGANPVTTNYFCSLNLKMFNVIQSLSVQTVVCVCVCVCACVRACVRACVCVHVLIGGTRLCCGLGAGGRADN